MEADAGGTIDRPERPVPDSGNPSFRIIPSFS